MTVEQAKGRIDLHILIDRTSIEVFANQGRASMFLSFPLDAENKTLEFFARDGSAMVSKMDIWQLKSVWS